ncbi:MAG TPA: efflux RND transporter periplasmic adaptor subunit [Steroidobacteraceae bacterium]|nr:efflux RND transporter periplasmic adaptor subunit [Steroidobacteraceae bacterium]
MSKRNRPAALAGLAAAALVAGCHGANQPAAPRAAAPLASVVVQRERTPVERRLDGLIEAVNEGTVAAQTSGRVVAILYDVNDFVPAGAVIVRLRATEQRAGMLQAEAALREAAARETEALSRYQRIADMYDRKVVPKATLDEVVANRDAAVARLAAARAALESAREGVAYTEVRAPYAGVVTRRLVQVGETVSPGTPLMSGLSLQYLRVTVDVPQSIVEQVRRIRKGAVYVAGRRIEATRVTVFPEAAAPSSTFRARLELPENAADLYPGMFVKVGFVTGEAERILAPAAALIERSEVTGVYVLDASGRTSLRQVRVGDQFDGRVEILSGLMPGERIALDPLAAARWLVPASAGSTS